MRDGMHVNSERNLTLGWTEPGSLSCKDIFEML